LFFFFFSFGIFYFEYKKRYTGVNKASVKKPLKI